MGHTHYFRYLTTSDGYAAAWPRMVADTRRICKVVTGAGVPLAGPLGSGTPVVDDTDGIWLNGTGRYQVAEALILLRPHTTPTDSQPWFCKTDRQPYDLAVTAILLRCHLLAPQSFRISSDSSWAEWAEPNTPGLPSSRQLVADLFGPLPDLRGWDDR
jgi:hypothetical protein